MTMTAPDERTPEEIERNIEATRASLRDTLTELEHRLSPSERVQEIRDRINPQSLLPWAAVGAVATGAVLAVRGFRRRRATSVEDSGLEEVVCFDAAVPSDIAP